MLEVICLYSCRYTIMYTIRLGHLGAVIDFVLNKKALINTKRNEQDLSKRKRDTKYI